MICRARARRRTHSTTRTIRTSRTSRTSRDAYSKHDSVVQDYPEGEDGAAELGEGAFEKNVHYPNEPFPLIGRPLEQQTDAFSGASGEAVRKIRELFPSKFARLTAVQGEGGR